MSPSTAAVTPVRLHPAWAGAPAAPVVPALPPAADERPVAPDNPSSLMVPSSDRIRGLADTLESEGRLALADLTRRVADALDAETGAP